MPFIAILNGDLYYRMRPLSVRYSTFCNDVKKRIGVREQRMEKEG